MTVSNWADFNEVVNGEEEAPEVAGEEGPEESEEEN